MELKGNISSEQKLKGKITAIPQLDETLTKHGYSADAKATGEAIAKAKSEALAGSRPNTWMPTASDVGAATPADVKKASPVNLLDNSDFRNPVNQRGYKNYTSEPKPETGADPNTCYGITQGYTIDRWGIWSEAGNTSVTVHNGYITFSASHHGTLYQRFEKGFLDSSKSYTLVVKKLNEPPSFVYPTHINYEWSVADTMTIADITNGNSVSLEWIALYEGEYTAETLPEYQPKDRVLELLACQQYRLELPLVDTGWYMGACIASTSHVAYATFELPVSLREGDAVPTITGTFVLRGQGKEHEVWISCEGVTGNKLHLKCDTAYEVLSEMQVYLLRATSAVTISKDL